VFLGNTLGSHVPHFTVARIVEVLFSTSRFEHPVDTAEVELITSSQFSKFESSIWLWKECNDRRDGTER